MGPLWGIDVGGTKIEGIVIDDSDNTHVLKRLRIPTEQEKGYEHILNQIAKLVEVLTAEVGMKPQSIGIGHPGTLEPSSQKLKNSNTTCLNGQFFKRDLEDIIGIPVKLANDANCFVIAETKIGIVRDEVPNAQVVFGVIMGTGVGGGLVINGKVINGRQGIAGEWGHNFIDNTGGDCYCGLTGCIETIISGPALEKYYESIVGIPRNLKEIIGRHHKGNDEIATQTVERLIHYFGKGIAGVINTIDPDAIVLGGGVGNIDLLYTAGVISAKKYIFNNNKIETPFLKPKLGDSAGVFGAAFL